MSNNSGISYRLCPYCNMMYDRSKAHQCKQKREFQRKRHKEYAKREKEVDRPLHTKKWYYLRHKIIAADGGECQRCLRKFGIHNHQHLEVHHIEARINNPKLIFNKNNLVTLCHSCNAQLATNGLDFNWLPKDRKFKHIHYGFAL